MRADDDADFGVSWLMSMFHADWTDHGPSAVAAVEYHLWDGLDAALVSSVLRDALLLRLPSATIEVLWSAGTTVGPSFFSGGRTGVASGTGWMRTLAGLCESWLSRHARADLPDPAAVPVPAEWDGTDLADAVLSEIGSASFVPEEAGHALAECVRHCTPDLAFRLLLQAMAESGTGCGAALTPEQYARLKSIGSALHHGEFVVSGVRHLVSDGWADSFG